MGLFESKEEKQIRLAKEAEEKAKIRQKIKENLIKDQANNKARKEAEAKEKARLLKEKNKPKRIIAHKNKVGLANVFPDYEHSKVLITQNETIINLLATIAIAQGAIAGTAANVIKEDYYKSLAKLELKEDSSEQGIE